MRKRMTLWLALVLFLSIPWMANAQGERGQPANIVLIGWDGAGREQIKASLSRNELPNLKKLGSEGALVAIDVLRTTDTKAGWAQILTGYEPEKTGVFSNSRHQPIPKGYTLFERLETFFGPDQIVTAAVIAKKNNLGADQGEPFYHAKESLDIFLNGLTKGEAVCTKTLALLEQYREKRFFLFVHFAEADHAGHAFGEDSKQYREALIALDAWLARIVEKLKALGLYERTLLYVTADHGLDEGLKSHSDAPYVFLATNDPKVKRRGQRADIAPTILTRFGLDPRAIDPPLDGHTLTEPYEAPVW